MSSQECRRCGGEIIFRYISGNRIPIHLSGGCSDGNYSGTSSTRANVFYSYSYNPDDFCRQTACPICGDPVYFIRHNGGSVWVDELGWPWPKHKCFVNDNADAVLEYTRKANKAQILCLIIQAEKRRDKVCDYIAVITEGGELLFLYISDLHEPEKMMGSLATIYVDEQKIVIGYSTAYKIVDTVSNSAKPEEKRYINDMYITTMEATKVKGTYHIACPECKSNLNWSRIYHHLVEIHASVVCPLCFRLTTTDKFDRHLREEHFLTKDHVTSCPICKDKIKMSLLQEHLWVLHKLERCPVCSQLIPTAKFDDHLQKEHSQEPRQKKRKPDANGKAF